jgi:hypothetical protein
MIFRNYLEADLSWFRKIVPLVTVLQLATEPGIKRLVYTCPSGCEFTLEVKV